VATPLTKIKELLGLGPNDWRARLRPNIELLSPDGDEYAASWTGDTRAKEKKIGLFNYPKIVGTIAQDLEMQSAQYDITFFFTGKDNDILAQQFWTSSDQKGEWTITHPVHGFLGLQMLSVYQQVEPVRSGNITEIQTTWIEPIDEATLKTAREWAGITDARIKDLNLNAAQQFADNIQQTTEILRNTTQDAADIVVGLTDKALSPLFTTSDALNNLVDGIQTSIQDILGAVILQPLALAGQIQQLTQLPLLAINDIAGRFDYYQTLTEEIFGIAPDSATQVSKNKTLVNELSLSAVIGANAKTATTGTLQTRAQAVEFAVDLTDKFEAITDNLDAIMLAFNQNDIDKQYFSQSQSFIDAALVTSAAMQYLFVAAFDLQVEKRFILEEARSPIEITVTEYGSLGENDENFDLFVDSNKLKGDDLLILEAGREVVVYV